MCECDNPVCTLPDGRCAACSTPTEACTNTELCAACAEKAAVIYAADAAVAGPDGAPWGIFNTRADGSVEIQRDDESDVFDHDEDACHYVVEKISAIPPRSPEQSMNTDIVRGPDFKRGLLTGLCLVLRNTQDSVAVAVVVDDANITRDDANAAGLDPADFNRLARVCGWTSDLNRDT